MSPDRRKTEQPTLAEYVHLVERLEADSSDCLDGTIDRLIDMICVAPWQTHDERSRAQSLVARLWRLKVRSVVK